jgi:hypothetical protein
MKRVLPIFAGIGAVILVGCASPTSTVQTPVGPNPTVPARRNSMGSLAVFSAGQQQENWGWDSEYPDYPSASADLQYQTHTGYSIYDATGQLVKNVDSNEKGTLGIEPRTIALPPGEYQIKALAAVGAGEWTQIPVVIEAGKTTEVHLNRQWTPPMNTPNGELVFSPEGFPVGWRAGVPWGR